MAERRISAEAKEIAGRVRGKLGQLIFFLQLAQWYRPFYATIEPHSPPWIALSLSANLEREKGIYVYT